MPKTNPLDHLHAQPVEEVVHALGELAARARAGGSEPVPTISLWLRSGREVSGRLLDVQRLSEVDWLLLARGELGAEPSAVDVCYLPLNAVEGLTVFGSADAPTEGPPAPSRVELRRRLAQLERELRGLASPALSCALDWRTVPEGVASAGAQASLGELLTLLGEVLSALAADELGKIALQAKLASIRVAIGPKAGVEFSEGRLAATTTADWGDRLRGEQLRGAINAGL